MSRDIEQIDAFKRKVLALVGDQATTGNDYVGLVAEAKHLGRKQDQDFLLYCIQDRFPRYLDRAPPNRADEAERALRVLIRSLAERFALDKNVLPNATVRTPDMTTPVARGVSGEITLRKYVEVAFVYRNAEGYRASISIEQVHPNYPVWSVASYWHKNAPNSPLNNPEEIERSESGLIAFSTVQKRCFEHLLGRVVAGQDLDTATEKGRVYRAM